MKVKNRGPFQDSQSMFRAFPYYLLPVNKLVLINPFALCLICPVKPEEKI